MPKCIGYHAPSYGNEWKARKRENVKTYPSLWDKGGSYRRSMKNSREQTCLGEVIIHREDGSSLLSLGGMLGRQKWR